MSATATNIFSVVDEEFVNPIARTISEYAHGEQFKQDKWKEAVQYCFQAGCSNSAEWKDYYLAGEEENASSREQLGEVIERTKAGKVIASKAFPKTWNTDKSIIGKALDGGVSIVDEDGNPRAKTAIQDEYKETMPSKAEKTEFEKLMISWETAMKIYPKVDEIGQSEFRARVMDALFDK